MYADRDLTRTEATSQERRGTGAAAAPYPRPCGALRRRARHRLGCSRPARPDRQRPLDRRPHDLGQPHRNPHRRPRLRHPQPFRRGLERRPAQPDRSRHRADRRSARHRPGRRLRPRHHPLSPCRGDRPPHPHPRPAVDLQSWRPPFDDDRQPVAGRQHRGLHLGRRHAAAAFRRGRHHRRRQVDGGRAAVEQGDRGSSGAARPHPRSAQRIRLGLSRQMRSASTPIRSTCPSGCSGWRNWSRCSIADANLWPRKSTCCATSSRSPSTSTARPPAVRSCAAATAAASPPTRRFPIAWPTFSRCSTRRWACWRARTSGPSTAPCATGWNRRSAIPPTASCSPRG